jgi:hypothetical protein
MSDPGRLFARLSKALLTDQEGIHPYKAKFWKAYLGEAYSLWEVVCQRSSRKEGWSSVQSFNIGELAAELKVEPEQLLGWLTRLSQEQVMAIEVVGEAEGPITVIKVQAWHDLPILTPSQAGQLSPALQAEHAAWLEESLRRFREGGLN